VGNDMFNEEQLADAKVRAGGDTIAALRAALAEEKRAHEETRKRVRSLEAQVTGFDCRFAGKWAEMGGSHCPPGKPCQRCELDAAERRAEEAEWERDALAARLAEAVGVLRWIEIHEAFHYSDDRTWALALKQAATDHLASLAPETKGGKG